MKMKIGMNNNLSFLVVSLVTLCHCDDCFNSYSYELCRVENEKKKKKTEQIPAKLQNSSIAVDESDGI